MTATSDTIWREPLLISPMTNEWRPSSNQLSGSNQASQVARWAAIQEQARSGQLQSNPDGQAPSLACAATSPAFSCCRSIIMQPPADMLLMLMIKWQLEKFACKRSVGWGLAG